MPTPFVFSVPGGVAVVDAPDYRAAEAEVRSRYPFLDLGVQDYLPVCMASLSERPLGARAIGLLRLIRDEGQGISGPSSLEDELHAILAEADGD